MNSAFKTSPLSGDIWFKIFAIGVGTFIVMEIEKKVSKYNDTRNLDRQTD